MTGHSPSRLLLGPQRPTINLADAIATAGIAVDRLAVISAGWQEAENDIDDLRAVIGTTLDDLCLYARAETVFVQAQVVQAQVVERAYRHRSSSVV